MLNFDEFRAVRKREANANEPVPQKAGSGSFIKKEKKNDKEFVEVEKKATGVAAAFNAVGDFLEMHEAQALYVILLLLDTFAAVAELELRNSMGLNIGVSDMMSNLLLKMSRAYLNFSIAYFLAEIVVVIITFKFSILGHWGYLMDMFIISTQIYLEGRGVGKVNRLLNIFRYWRFLRLFNAMVGLEKEMHERTKETVELKEAEMNKLKLEVSGLKTEVTKEKEARDSIEGMLQCYREEVDTLNEALKIAAMDIAEVAQADDDMFDDEDDDDMQDIDDDLLSRTLTMESSIRSSTIGGDDISLAKSQSEYSKYKASVMRAVMDDQRQSTGNKAMKSSSTTFLVKEERL